MKRHLFSSIIFALYSMSSFSQNCNYFCNPDFDSIQFAGSANIFLTSAQLPCWYTTASDSLMELWKSGYNGVNSYSGNQFMELNAFMPATVYQNISVSPGTQIAIGFAHRGRGGIDTISVSAGPLGGPYTTLAYFGDPDGAWAYHTTNYIVPNSGTNYSIRFNSVYWSFGNPGVGNFLDAVSICGTSVNCVFISSDTTFCDKKCIDFTDLSTNNPTSWTWSFPGAVPSSSTQQNPTNICYNSFGSFDVSLIACNANTCDTLLMPGFINEFSVPSIPVITQSTDTLFANSAFSFAWYNASNPGSIVSTQSYCVPGALGDYYVIVCDSNGCCSSSALFTVVGINSDFQDQTSLDFQIKEIRNNELHFLIKSENNEKVRISLINLTGQILISEELRLLRDQNEGVIKLGGLSDGFYLVSLSTTRATHTYKFSLFTR